MSMTLRVCYIDHGPCSYFWILPEFWQTLHNVGIGPYPCPLEQFLPIHFPVLGEASDCNWHRRKQAQALLDAESEVSELLDILPVNDDKDIICLHIMKCPQSSAKFKHKTTVLKNCTKGVLKFPNYSGKFVQCPMLFVHSQINVQNLGCEPSFCIHLFSYLLFSLFIVPCVSRLHKHA